MVLNYNTVTHNYLSTFSSMYMYSYFRDCKNNFWCGPSSPRSSSYAHKQISEISALVLTCYPIHSILLFSCESHWHFVHVMLASSHFFTGENQATAEKRSSLRHHENYFLLPLQEYCYIMSTCRSIVPDLLLVRIRHSTPVAVRDSPSFVYCRSAVNFPMFNCFRGWPPIKQNRSSLIGNKWEVKIRQIYTVMNGIFLWHKLQVFCIMAGLAAIPGPLICTYFSLYIFWQYFRYEHYIFI